MVGILWTMGQAFKQGIWAKGLRAICDRLAYA